MDPKSRRHLIQEIVFALAAAATVIGAYQGLLWYAVETHTP